MAILPRDAAVSGELYHIDPIALYSVYLFLNMVVLSIMVVVFRYLHKRYRETENAKQWLLFPIFPISQLAALLNFAAIYIQKEFLLWGLITTIAVFVLADIALIAFIRMTAKNAKLQMRTELLEEQISFQKDYYKQLADSYENVRKMRHDIDNHLYTIQALLASGEIRGAEEYKKQVTGLADLSEGFEQCQNKVVASYLEKKKEDFAMERIPFETKIVLPEDCGIENPDLICALGNLLNNAQEATARLEDGFISLELSYRSPYLSICVKNRIKLETESKKPRRIAELERGIGMSILEEMARQYDGDLKIQREQDVFRADLVLKGRSHVDDSDL
ncbi:MAG: GHKL domain-containing protein [Clostridiales bacterium]|nr:GHKL domain-containing protein [Clostridiales bacterium]